MASLRHFAMTPAQRAVGKSNRFRPGFRTRCIGMSNTSRERTREKYREKERERASETQRKWNNEFTAATHLYVGIRVRPSRRTSSRGEWRVILSSYLSQHARIRISRREEKKKTNGRKIYGVSRNHCTPPLIVSFWLKRSFLTDIL